MFFKNFFLSAALASVAILVARADDFGEPLEYVYSIAENGDDLIISIDGREKTYSFYHMSKETGVELAFNAAKATCEDGMAVEGANYCE